MRPIRVTTGQLTAGQLDGSSPVVGGSGCITWHSSYETTDTASASYALFDGPAASGQQLLYVTLSAGESTRDYIGMHALSYLNSLFLVVESGSVALNLQAWGDHVCQHWYDWHERVLNLEGGAAAKEIMAAGG